MRSLLFVLTIVLLSLNSFAAKVKKAKDNACVPNIANAGHDAFMKAPGITEAQKIKLTEIMKIVMGDAQKVKMEIAKNKIELFSAITSPTAKEEDVQKLKTKIVELDQQRLSLMFKALDDVQKIIGKNQETGEYLRKIMQERMKSGDRGE